MNNIYCQDANNYLSLSSSVTAVNLSTVAALETQQVQSNAISITLKSRLSNFSVYANFSSRTSSNGTVLPAGSVSLQLNTVTPARAANFTKIPITTSNQLIIQTTKTGTATVTYNYDYIVGPIGFIADAGTYNYTILFTMTQP